jgi:hypothetical protein
LVSGAFGFKAKKMFPFDFLKSLWLEQTFHLVSGAFGLKALKMFPFDFLRSLWLGLTISLGFRRIWF